MSGTSGFKGSGITDPFLTPDAPTVDSVSTELGSASISFTAPTNTGGSAITSYVASVKQGDGTSVSNTGTSSPIDVALTAGGTAQFAVQAFNTYGAGQFGGYGNDASVSASAELYASGASTEGALGLNDLIFRSSPVQVGSATNYKKAEGYERTAIFLKTDGTIWSVGRNNTGQLGLNTNYLVNTSSPTQIGSDTDWNRIGKGGTNSDTPGAIKTDGSLYLWGFADYGQLGDGTVIRRSSPVQIGSLTNWASYAPAAGTALALKTDGTIWAWGGNGSGQIGDNTIVSKSSPVQIGSDTNWSIVKSYNDGGLAITSDNELYSWGRNNNGQLGQNLSSAVNVSSPVQIGTGYSKISASSHVLAVKTDGTLWVWGNDNAGKLGLNTRNVARSSPVQVGALTNWSFPICGSQTSFAFKTDGTLWAWGDGGEAGNYGNNSIIRRSSPVQVGSAGDWVDIGTDSAFSHWLKGV